MGKKKENENLAEELAKCFERWEYLKEHGGSDPFWADGTNMNLVRNHIMYYKNSMVRIMKNTRKFSTGSCRRR